jgi:cellobiose epimerase
MSGPHDDILREWEQEYAAILNWWATYMPDQQHGFHGEVNLNNEPVPDANRGLVLYSRILWTFSTAIRNGYKEPFTALSADAFQYLRNFFQDTTQGGYYWSVTAKGEPHETHKQLYGQAFALYAFAAYYTATGNKDALAAAIELFWLLEKHGHDPVYGGYGEARTASWKPLPGNRLSEKDPVVDKSMNTHLHILEAYTTLYVVWQDPDLEQAIRSLLHLFQTHIIDSYSNSLQVYLAADWTPISTHRSFGHDIEASWLLFEAASVLKDLSVLEKQAVCSLQMVRSAISGLDSDGGMCNEFDPRTHHLDREKHWWPQAECIPGFLNAYQISGETAFLHHALNAWTFIKNSIRHTTGEWIWGLDQQGAWIPESKAGFWKCPYHNSRALMEGIHRLKLIVEK